MNTQLQPITELDSLPADKREILHEWIENLGYRKAMEKLKSEWQLEVTYNKVYRYYRRILQKQPFDDILEDEIAMSDFLALLNGKSVPYDQAGIELVMKRAFDLTCARQIKPSTLATLLRVFHYKKNCEWNQRRLAQNDKRIDIADRLARLKETSSSSQKNSSLSSSPREDHLGPLAKNMDGVEARAKMKFGSLNEANGLQSESPGISDSLPLAPELQSGDDTAQRKVSTVSTVSPESSQPTSSSCASCPSVEKASTLVVKSWRKLVTLAETVGRLNRAVLFAGGGRAAATGFELQLAEPPVATRNGLASPPANRRACGVR